MSAATPRSWAEMRDWSRSLLERSGVGLEEWSSRVAASGLATEPEVRAWLDAQGVRGYAQMLVVMERFGYPDYLLAAPEELLDAQYADRPALRPVYDAVLAGVPLLGPVTVQHRKTYVCLVTPRRTFAQLHAATRTRLDLGLRLDGVAGAEVLSPAPSSLGSSTHRIALSSVEDVDEGVREWLARAYASNT